MSNKKETHLCNTCINQYAHLCEMVRRGTPEGLDGITWVAKPYKLNNRRIGAISKTPMYTILKCDRYIKDEQDIYKNRLRKK